MITLIHLAGARICTLEAALDRLGHDHCLARTPEDAAADGPLLLLGTGVYEGACAALKAAGWWRNLPQMVADGRHLLGINGGMHLLAEGSEESPLGDGLGLIPGLVRHLGPGVKVPHVGWSQVRQQQAHPGIPDLHSGWLNFAHRHALEPTSETLIVASHGRPFSVLEIRGRVLGLQANPEKSGALGLVFLEKLLAAMGEKPQPVVPADSCN